MEIETKKQSFEIRRFAEDEYSTQNQMKYDQRFADKLRIYAKGGRGGNGCFSFDTSSMYMKTPDGGDGGKGGSVYLMASKRVHNLHNMKRSHFNGNMGRSGHG